MAQFEGSNLLPVKIDHQWGLIDDNGTVVMEPKYDLFGKKFGGVRQTAAGFRTLYVTVQLNDSLGLINNRGNEILPPKYDDIINVYADSIFVVKKNGKILVVNPQGKTVFDGEYETVIPIRRRRDLFIVKEDGLYGLIKNGAGYLIPNTYDSLALNKIIYPYLNFWTAKSYKKGQFGLIDFENNILLPPDYKSIKIVTENHFLTKNKFYELFDSNQKSLISDQEEWTQATILSKSFIAFKSSFQKKGKIYSTRSNRYIKTKTEYDDFKKLNNDFLIGIKDGKFGLIDTLGNEIIPPRYSAIIPMEGDSLFKVKKIKWGIFKINEGLITPCDYDDIKNYNNLFAEIIKGQTLGLINRKGEVVAPTQFHHFQFQAEFIKAFAGQKMHFYESNAEGQLTLLDIYPEVYTLKIGYGEDLNAIPNVRIGGNASNRQRFRRNARRGIKKTPDYSKIENSDVEWFKDWGIWGLRRKSTGETIIKPQYEFIQNLPFTDLTIVYNFDKKIDKNDLLQWMTINPKKGAYSIAFYSHQQEKFVTGFDLMGVRVEDFEYDLPHAACLDKSGKMILVNKKGQLSYQKKPFDYIGEFFEGKARICINASIQPEKIGNENGNKITTSSALQAAFKVRFNRFITAPTSDLWWMGGTWGFIDSTGKITIPPNYSYVNEFENGSAICQKENWGVINDKNQTILDFSFRSIKRKQDRFIAGVKNRRPVFYNAKGNSVVDWGYEKFRSFSEGFCPVFKNGKWGLVNDKGEEIFECKYQSINGFKEGLAGIQDEEGWYFVDTSMTIKLDFRDRDYVSMGNFSQGLCWYKIKRNDKHYYGYIDTKGENIINSSFTKAFDFQQGRARVVQKRKTGLIDSSGTFILIPEKYDLVFPFDKNGMAQVKESNMGLIGLININGESIAPCIYNKIFPFVDGYAKMVTAKGIGFLDTLGNVIIPPKYRAVGELSEGLVAVQTGFSYLWQYINMDNKIAFPGKFSIAEPFQNGKAIVTMRRAEESENIVIDKKGQQVILENNGMVLHFSERKYGFRRFIRNTDGIVTDTYCYFSDTTGTQLFNGQRFRDIQPFENKIGLVQHKNRKWSTINHRGYSIIPEKFHQIFKLPNNMFSAIAGELFALYDWQGNLILDPIYDDIEMIKMGLFKVEQGSKIGYFTSEGTWLWQMQD